MSICFEGFLGKEIQNIETRLIEEFSSLGFHIEIHPDVNLLDSKNFDVLHIKVNKTPVCLKRISPATPLLVSFGYYSKRRDAALQTEEGDPPRRVRKYSYRISTRTSAGRSFSAVHMQALTVAVLAKISNGRFHGDDDAEAVSGSAGLQKIVDELHNTSDIFFDSNAFPFESWPSLGEDSNFKYPEIINKTLKNTQEGIFHVPHKRKININYSYLFFGFIFLYFLIATII
ncbi:hypothetical protein [Comamonas guangdongensis]|uniref:Uncharacterized protein n=1 Tax=Comamonas guangdongensis TaxID=510515 RepID=A0ABV3ZZV2_9BURK